MLKNKFLALIVLSVSLTACSNSVNSTNLNSLTYQSNKGINSKNFNVKFSSSFNPEAYLLAHLDIKNAIKNKTIPDEVYHYTYALTYEPSRLSSSNYLQIKSRVESGEWSEDAYLLANPDVKAAVDAGTVISGYSHWYNYAITAEPSRKTSTAYLNAKSAIDAGFNENAYRTRWRDVDSLIRSGSLPSAYAHWNTWAKNNETIRLSDPTYIKIKNALMYKFDENAYRLAYPDVDSAVRSGSLPNALTHYINQGMNEGRLETIIYQDAKLALMLDFNETRYRLAFLDVNLALLAGVYPSGFHHFHLYGKHEDRLNRLIYKTTGLP